MKPKQWMGGLSLILLMATVPFGCNSQTEKKGEEVQEEYKDVVDARAEGDTAELREEQSELDSARQEYRELGKDSTRQ